MAAAEPSVETVAETAADVAVAAGGDATAAVVAAAARFDSLLRGPRLLCFDTATAAADSLDETAAVAAAD